MGYIGMWGPKGHSSHRFWSEIGYRIYSIKRRPRLSAAHGMEKLISAAAAVRRLFEYFLC